MDGWMDEWMDGWMDGWIDGWWMECMHGIDSHDGGAAVDADADAACGS